MEKEKKKYLTPGQRFSFHIDVIRRIIIIDKVKIIVLKE